MQYQRIQFQTSLLLYHTQTTHLILNVICTINFFRNLTFGKLILNVSLMNILRITTSNMTCFLVSCNFQRIGPFRKKKYKAISPHFGLAIWELCFSFFKHNFSLNTFLLLPGSICKCIAIFTTCVLKAQSCKLKKYR